MPWRPLPNARTRRPAPLTCAIPAPGWPLLGCPGEGWDALGQFDGRTYASGPPLVVASLVGPARSRPFSIEHFGGPFEDHHLTGDVLDRATDAWERGELYDARGEPTYSLTRLDDDEFARVRQAFEG